MPDKINHINKEIEELKNEGISTKDISDGYHTFQELYEHRIILFSALCNVYPDISWKSKKHYDNEADPMFDDSFIAGINTPLGPATYHVKLKYWDLFDIPEIERALEYDGYSSEDVLLRIKSLNDKKS